MNCQAVEPQRERHSRSEHGLAMRTKKGEENFRSTLFFHLTQSHALLPSRVSFTHHIRLPACSGRSFSVCLFALRLEDRKRLLAEAKIRRPHSSKQSKAKSDSSFAPLPVFVRVFFSLVRLKAERAACIYTYTPSFFSTASSVPALRVFRDRSIHHHPSLPFCVNYFALCVFQERHARTHHTEGLCDRADKRAGRQGRRRAETQHADSTAQAGERWKELTEARGRSRPISQAKQNSITKPTNERIMKFLLNPESFSQTNYI
mmetsp:Transcript_14870/g.30020  ORF Transcript_14870/g.30020 Transcript_14870/m.30020 type:complete len:261 (-) Transcript_14870:1567-2349(-)